MQSNIQSIFCSLPIVHTGSNQFLVHGSLHLFTQHSLFSTRLDHGLTSRMTSIPGNQISSNPIEMNLLRYGTTMPRVDMKVEFSIRQWAACTLNHIEVQGCNLSPESAASGREWKDRPDRQTWIQNHRGLQSAQTGCAERMHLFFFSSIRE